MKYKLILLILLNLLTLSFGIFSYTYTLNFQTQDPHSQFYKFTIGSSFIFPLSILFFTLQHLSAHSDELACSCMAWSLFKFITISFSLAWYGFALNLFVKLTSDFPCINTYGWITLTYFLIYSIIWGFSLSVLGGMCLYLAIKQTQFKGGFWIMFLIFTLPLINCTVQLNEPQITLSNSSLTSLSIMSTVLVLISLLITYIEIRYYNSFEHPQINSCVISCFQCSQFFLLPFQGFVLVISVIYEVSTQDLFTKSQHYGKVLVTFTFIMGMIAVFANPVRYHFLSKLVLQQLDFKEGLVYFQKLLNQSIRGVNLACTVFLLIRWHISSVQITFFLLTLIPFTIIKSLIQSKKITLLYNHQTVQSQFLNRLYKVLTIGIIYAQVLEVMFCVIFYGFLGSFEILVLLCLQSYFLFILIPQTIYHTSKQFTKLNLPEEEILLDQENQELELEEVANNNIDFNSVLAEVTLDEAQNNECCICCEEMKNASVSKIVQCGHSFHTLCIKNWLHTKPNCPIDRRKV